MAPLLDLLDRRLWAVALGVALAGAALFALGTQGVWVLLLLTLIAAIVLRLVMPMPSRVRAAAQPDGQREHPRRPWCARCWDRCRCR